MSSGSSPAPRSAPPARAISSRCGSRSRRCRASACCSSEFQAPLVRSLAAELDDLPDLRSELERTLVDEPPALARDGGVVRDGVDPELDDLRGISRSGQQRIAEMEEAERARTGISSLKIRFNRVFGYYIEISQSNLAQRAGRLPPQADDRRRRAVHHPGAQGLRGEGARRRRAHPRARAGDLRGAAARVAAEAPRMQDTARGLASLRRARARSPKPPRSRTTPSRMMHAGDELVATDARHAVVERHAADAFVPERHHARRRGASARDPDRPQHGRQVDVPAPDGAALPDGAGRIVRAGAHGQAAGRRSPLRARRRRPTTSRAASRRSWSRCRRPRTSCTARRRAAWSSSTRSAAARRRSTGSAWRGRWPSTWRRTPRARPKTIFATHYHELTDLADALPCVANFHVVVREWKDDIVFLRKVVPGRSDRSYGIQVARLAGLPPPVVGARARDPERARARRAVARRTSVAERQPASAAGSSSGCSRRPSADDDPVHRRLRGAGRQRHHADAGADAARGAEGRGRVMRRARPRAAAWPGRSCGRSSLALALACRAASARRRTRSSSAMANSAINLDPRVGTDDASQKLHQLLFNTLVRIDDQLRVVPDLAESLEQPDPLTYVAHLRRGVLFHNGRELTSDDVVYTFRSFLDPAFRGRTGAYRQLAAVNALDRYTVEFKLKKPLGLVSDQPGDGDRAGGLGRGERASADRHRTVPAGAVRAGRPRRPRGIRRTTTAARRRNDGLVLKVIPDDTMRGLELRKGTVDLIVNDLSPDIVWQLRHEGRVQVETAPGTDYAYVGLNLQDPVLSHLEVRRPSAMRSIVTPSSITCAAALPQPPSASCRRCPGRSSATCSTSRTTRREAGRLLDAAGYPDPDGAGPLPAVPPVAEDLDVGGLPAPGRGDSARSRPRRHRHRRPVVGVPDAFGRRARAETFSSIRCSWSASPIPTFCGSCTTRSRSAGRT